MGRWRLDEDKARSWSGRQGRHLVDRAHGGSTWKLRREHGMSGSGERRPRHRRVWWNDTGVHQNLTFAVQPDPISGMQCWHQRVHVTRRPRRATSTATWSVDTAKSREAYLEWLAKTRPGPGPRRPAPPPVVRTRLGLSPDTELVYIDRVRFAGDEPLAIDRIWLPSDIAEPLLDADFTRTSLYNELDRTIGKRPNEGWERIHPAIPSADERTCLALDDDAAVFSIERLGTHNGEPLEWRVTTIRGDRFTFVADWTAGQRNELRFQMVNG
jgi:hypothetical protein